MRTVYTKYFESTDLSGSYPEDFLNLFQDLILYYNGDISQVLDILEKLNANYGLLDKDFDRDKIEEELKKNALIDIKDGHYKLNLKGKRWLEKNIFKDFFKNLKLNNDGEHQNRFYGSSLNVQTETRPYYAGDDFSNINFRESVNNALKRNYGTSFSMNYDDLVTNTNSGNSSVASVLLVDISHSMILYGEDRITPAKKVAMALCELIQRKYPKDRIHVCVFGNDAWEIPLNNLDQISVGPFHTNTLSALELASKLLKKYPYLDKQIIMITDGKPTCIKENGEYYKNSFGHDPHVINKVLRQAIELKRKSIPVNTFMLTDDPYLVEFVDEFTKLNAGKAFYVNLQDLSKSVIKSFINYRKKK